MSQDESIKIFRVLKLSVYVASGVRRIPDKWILWPSYSFPPLMNALVGKMPDGRRIT